MPKNIYNIIQQDDELLKLYNNDPLFRTTIDTSVRNKMSVQDTLIFALKYGYKSRQELNKNYLHHMQRCTSRIMY